MSRRDSIVLRAFAIWTIYVWVTRMWVIAHDHAKGHGLAFKTVHATLAIISCGFAAAALVIVARIRRSRPAVTRLAGTGLSGGAG